MGLKLPFTPGQSASVKQRATITYGSMVSVIAVKVGVCHSTNQDVLINYWVSGGTATPLVGNLNSRNAFLRTPQSQSLIRR